MNMETSRSERTYRAALKRFAAALTELNAAAHAMTREQSSEDNAVDRILSDLSTELLKSDYPVTPPNVVPHNHKLEIIEDAAGFVLCEAGKPIGGPFKDRAEAVRQRNVRLAEIAIAISKDQVAAFVTGLWPPDLGD
jgi:hypothetical protein